MKVVIIGAVAAGTKTAAKLKRELGDECQVTLLEKHPYISYSGCGLPYYVGGEVADIDKLYTNTPDEYRKVTEVDLHCQTEAIGIDREKKFVYSRQVETGETMTFPYDKLVLAVGASPIRPPVEGNELPGTFVLRTPEDAEKLRQFLQQGVKRAVVVGGGLIGLEIADELKNQGIRTVILEGAPHILPGFDPDFAEHAENLLMEEGIPVFTQEKLLAIEGEAKVEAVKTQNRRIKADAVIFAVGVRPNTDMLFGSGLIMTANGAIVTDSQMKTNDPNIFAVGDCATVHNRQTGERVWAPLGSIANLTGRICAEVIAGHPVQYPGTLGTAIVKFAGGNAAKTGMTVTQANALGRKVIHATISIDDKVNFYPGASVLNIRLVADSETHKLLGVQVTGKNAVDKIVDMGVALITLGARLEEIQNMDFSYAPPFSLAIHPFVHATNVLLNKAAGKMVGVDMDEFRQLPEQTVYLDVMKTANIDGYRSAPVKTIHGDLDGIGKEQFIALVCEKGKQGYLAQNKLQRYGYKHTVVLEGGTKFNDIEND